MNLPARPRVVKHYSRNLFKSPLRDDNLGAGRHPKLNILTSEKVALTY